MSFDDYLSSFDIDEHVEQFFHSINNTYFPLYDEDFVYNYPDDMDIVDDSILLTSSNNIIRTNSKQLAPSSPLSLVTQPNMDNEINKDKDADPDREQQYKYRYDQNNQQQPLRKITIQLPLKACAPSHVILHIYSEFTDVFEVFKVYHCIKTCHTSSDKTYRTHSSSGLFFINGHRYNDLLHYKNYVNDFYQQYKPTLRSFNKSSPRIYLSHAGATKAKCFNLTYNSSFLY